MYSEDVDMHGRRKYDVFLSDIIKAIELKHDSAFVLRKMNESRNKYLCN